MLKTKEIKDRILELLVEDKNKPYIIGSGILIDSVICFDENGIEKSKKEIAKILQEIGVDEYPLISLSTLTTLKNGETWNPLEKIEDFLVLDLLLACANACGFIHNNSTIKQMNINEIGSPNSTLISKSGKALVGDDQEWLKLMRESVIHKIYFLPEQKSIKEFTTDNQKIVKKPVQKSKKR